MHHACTATRNVQVRGLLLETLGQRALCAGWLIKLGTERKNWRKRFAVLLAEPTNHLSIALVDELTEALVEKETVDFRELYKMVEKTQPELARAQIEKQVSMTGA